MVNCPKCGSYNPTENKFCSECGNSLNKNLTDSPKENYSKNQQGNSNNNQSQISSNQNNKGKNEELGCCGMIILFVILLAIARYILVPISSIILGV